MTEQPNREEMLAAARAQLGWTDAVDRFRPHLFQVVAVQLKDAYWQLAHRGVKFNQIPRLVDDLDATGKEKGFTVVIPFCVLQPSPMRDMIRLAIPDEDPGAPTQMIDLPPESILYVSSLFATVIQEVAESPRIVSAG